MNYIYKSIFNESLGAWVAVSEIDSAKGKKSSGGNFAALKLLVLTLSAFGVVGLSSGLALAQSNQGNVDLRTYSSKENTGTIMVEFPGYKDCDSKVDPAHTGSIAFGCGAEATAQSGDVAFGGGSKTATVVATTSGTLKNESDIEVITFGNFAGTDPESTFSIGDVDKERTLTNVAAGRVSPTSTDAINGSQLHSMGEALIHYVDSIDSNNFHYFSVNSTQQGTGSNYLNDGATGGESIAIGSYATTGTGTNEPVAAVALGHKVNASTSGSIAIGHTAQAGRDHNYGLLDWVNSQSDLMNYGFDFTDEASLKAYVDEVQVKKDKKARVTQAEEFVYRSVIAHNNNVAIGVGASVAGGRNIAIGENAGGTNATTTADLPQDRTAFNNFGIQNVNIGTNSGTNNQNVDNSVAIGFQAAYLDPTTSAGRNAIVAQDTVKWNARSANTYIGDKAGYNTAAFGNIGIGVQAGHGITDVYNNGSVFIGNQAGGTSSSGTVEYVRNPDNSKDTFLYPVDATGKLVNPGGPIISGANTAVGPQAFRGATGSGNTALGRYAMQSAKGGANTALGEGALLTGIGDLNVAIGALSGSYNNRASRAVMIGAGSQAYGNTSIAIGNSARTGLSDQATLLMNGVAIGNSALALADSSIALGKRASASADDVTADASIAIGSNAMAKGKGSIALGGATDVSTELVANKVNGNAPGHGSNIDTLIPDATKNPVANADYGIALGTASVAGADKADENAIAIGKGAQALALNSIAIGTGNIVTGIGSGAIGDPSNISGAGSYSLGNNNTIAQNNTFVVGNDVITTQANSVVLGNLSTDRAATAETQGTVGGITYGTFAGVGSPTKGVVSVGAAGAERQIINVAAGKISANSTDAINGSQLFATNKVIANVANSTVTILGGNATLTENGTITMTNIGDTGENTVHDAIKKVSGDVTNVEIIASKGWDISANGELKANVAPGGLVDFNNTDTNILVTRTGTNITHDLSADLKIDNSVTIGGDTNNQTIIKQGDVTSNTVNTTNLTVSGETKLGDNFWVTNQGDVHYNGPITADTHIVNKHYVDNIIGETSAKGWNLSANGGVATYVAPEATVDFSNTDGNIVVTQTGTNMAFDLSDNVQIGESITIGGDTTNQTVINQGNITTNTMNVGGNTMVVNEGSVTIQEGTTVNMGGNRITNVAPGVSNSDAATVGQLGAVTNQLRGDLNSVDRHARAGIASAAAMANLPQAYLPGKSMFAVAAAGHRGEHGYAAGLSTVSDNGKWIMKGSVSGNSRGNVTYGAGVGYQW
ncbi:MAG: YadA-like family protein [Alcaligenaceae bacterium]|nr:YadA-like family protein [Alcaligenaceae bacterium]